MPFLRRVLLGSSGLPLCERKKSTNLGILSQYFYRLYLTDPFKVSKKFSLGISISITRVPASTFKKAVIMILSMPSYFGGSYKLIIG